MKFNSIFLITCLFVTTTAMAQGKQPATPSPYNFDALTKKLEASTKELGKSFAVAIQKDGKLVYNKKIGEELDSKTQTPIFATSQWLTAALVMTYVDEGKLTLDTKVSDYLPIFAKYGKSYITIRHCLAHLSGIQSKRSTSGFTAKSKTDKLEDEVNEFVKKEIENNAGVELWYSSYGPSIAARVLEVLTKKPFDRLMSERILRPLLMRSTNFTAEKAVNAAGGSTSTGIDFLNFTAMLQGKGMFNGKRILSENAIEQMFTAQATPAMIKYLPDALKGYEVGLGTIIQERDANGKATVVSCPSFYGTWVVVDYCKGYSCIILTKELSNETPQTLYNSIKSIIDEAIGGGCK